MKREIVDKKIRQLNKLHSEIQKHKNQYPKHKTIYSFSIGSILNAYHEGDITFDNAIKEIKLLKN